MKSLLCCLSVLTGFELFAAYAYVTNVIDDVVWKYRIDGTSAQLLRAELTEPSSSDVLKCRVLGEVRFSKKVIASFQVKRSVFTKCICVNRNDGGCPSWIRIYCFNTDKVLAMLNNWLKDECSDCVR